MSARSVGNNVRSVTQDARPTILVIEDDRDIRDDVRDIVADEGYGCVAVETAEEGIEYLQSHPPPCLVLLDLKLPRMDGVAFIRWLGGQENLRGMRIAVISASAGRFRSDLDAFREHVVSVTQKPFDLDIVLKQVEEHCGRPSP